MLYGFAERGASADIGHELGWAGRVILLSSTIHLRATAAVMSSVAMAGLRRPRSSARARSMTQSACR
jgi:hypothetical protein